MKDEKVFHDYANFKLDNESLIKELKKVESEVLERFEHVIDVADYYYDKLIDDKDFSEEDHHVFTIAFMYLEEQVEQVKELLKTVYNNKVAELEKHAKEVNLLLNTFDFQTEVLNNEFEDDDDVKVLLEFDKDIFDYLTKYMEVPVEKYNQLDELTYRIFNKNNRNYYSINSIFYEIADELEIL